MQPACFRNYVRTHCYLALIDLINAINLDLSSVRKMPQQ
jgi:hypothetical protein